jgi:hypothetical protein
MIRTATSLALAIAGDFVQWALYQSARRRLGLPEAEQRVDEKERDLDARLAILEQRRAARERFARRAA